jgi:group I intron endonuclease
MRKPIVGLYIIKNKINNKIYIGSSNNILLRWWQHKNNAIKGSTKCPKLYSAIRKYGIDNFEWNILEECNVDELYLKEQKWLDSNFDDANYNVSKYADAPMRNRKFSEEHCQKLKSARNKRVFSEETREKMAKSHMGKRFKNVKCSGENNYKAKYTNEIILQIRSDYANGNSVSSICKKYYIPKTTAWNIIKRRTWKYV